MEFIFFLLFAGTLAFMYLSVRRGWLPGSWTAGGGVLACIITMTLFTIARGTSILQGVVTGIFLGAIFAGATLAIAWYFHSNEIRAYQAAQQADYPHDYHPEEVPGEEYYEGA